MDATAYALANAIPKTKTVANSTTAKTSVGAERIHFAMCTLSDGSVLITGGGGYSAPRGGKLYTPSTNTWTTKASIPGTYARERHAMSAMPGNGALVIAGYQGGVGRVSSCYYWSLATNTMATRASLPSILQDHRASMLDSGDVFVTGGTTNGSWAINYCYSYNYTLNTWTSKANLPIRRMYHSQSTLADGTVLVCGGYDSGVKTSVYQYTPGTNTWATKTSLTVGRYSHMQASLGNSTVFIGGGTSQANAQTVVVYDPATGSSTTKINMLQARDSGLASPLGAGEVLVVGGDGLNSGPVEKYDAGGDFPLPGRAALLGYLAAN